MSVSSYVKTGSWNLYSCMRLAMSPMAREKSESGLTAYGRMSFIRGMDHPLALVWHAPLEHGSQNDSTRARYLRACHTGSGEARNRNTLRGKYSTRTRGCQTGECVSVTLIRKATRRQSRAVSSVHRRANSATNVVVIDELANPRHNTANQNPAEPFRRQTASEGAPRWRSLARFCAGLDGQGALRTRGR